MLEETGKRARTAARQLNLLSSERKQALLEQLSARLWDSRLDIIQANQIDIEAAQKAGLDTAMIDRLTINEKRLQGITSDLKRVAELPDPVGEIYEPFTLPNGLKLSKMRIPIGVLAVIYESRPNVTIDIAGLALKSGNAAILRGGSETLNTNRKMMEIIHQALTENQAPVDAIQFIDNPDRALVAELLRLHEYVDLLIPRGGASLHKFCRENSSIPVITGGMGICHLYVDESADLDKSLAVIANAKTQRPTVCNALDTVLVHPTVAAAFLPRLVKHLATMGVTFQVDPSALPFLKDFPGNLVKEAGPDDFDTEWMSLVLGLKVITGLEEAIDFINNHSMGHSDGILTRNDEHARLFIQRVDSAAVYVNASTRFTDGAEFGLGAEVAISTQRIHARGPMGLRELTTYKWIGQGDYHIRK